MLLMWIYYFLETLGEITFFVSKEISPVLDDKNPTFPVYIYRSCNGFTEKIVSITMQSNNYYLLWISGIELPADIVKYDNRLEVDIDREGLIWAIEKSTELQFDKFSTNEDAKHMLIKSS